MIADKSFDSLVIGKGGSISPIFSVTVTLLLLSIIPEAIFMSSWKLIGIIDGSLLLFFLTCEAYCPFIYRSIIKHYRVTYGQVCDNSDLGKDCECGQPPYEFHAFIRSACIVYKCGTKVKLDRLGRLSDVKVGDLCTRAKEDVI